MKDAGSRRSGFGSVVCTQQSSRGHLGNIQGPWGKVTLDPGKGKGSGQRALQGHDGRGKSRSSHLTKVFHCTHIVSTPSVSTTAPAISSVVPASHPFRGGHPQAERQASWEGSRLRRSRPLPAQRSHLSPGTSCLPKSQL